MRAFEIELGFEGLVDGLDDLAECFESLAAWSGFLGFERGPDQGDAGVVEFGFEGGSPVALVGDKCLAFAVEVAERDHVQGGVAFVDFGAGERVSDGES